MKLFKALIPVTIFTIVTLTSLSNTFAETPQQAPVNSKYPNPFKTLLKERADYERRKTEYIEKYSKDIQEQMAERPEYYKFIRLTNIRIEKVNAEILKAYIRKVAVVTPRIQALERKITRYTSNQPRNNQFLKDQRAKLEKELEQALNSFKEKVVVFEPIPEKLLTEKAYTDKYSWLQRVK